MTSLPFRSPRLKPKQQHHQLFLTADGDESAAEQAKTKGDFEELKQAKGEESMEVFVSAISSPAHFFVQKARQYFVTFLCIFDRFCDLISTFHFKYIIGTKIIHEPSLTFSTHEKR